MLINQRLLNTYAVLDSAGINGAISSEELVSLAEENGISINQAGNISQFFEETPEQSETHSRYEEWLKNHPANKRGDTEEDNEQPGSHSRYEEWLKNHPTNVISAAIESIKSGDLGGINEIKTLTDNGYALTEADKTKIYEAIYNTGIKLYRADNTEKAKRFFETVDPYMDSARYLVLIDFISDEFTIESIERAQSDLKLFPDDLNFENLKEIVVSNFIFATKFLNGRWKDENGKKSLEIICDDVLKDQRAEGTNPLRVRYLGEIPIDGTHNYRSKWETFSDAFHSEILFDNADIYIEIVRINPNAWPKTITSMDFEMFQRMTDKEFKEYYSDYDEENMKVYHIEVVDKNTIVLTRYSHGVELTLYRQ